MSVTLRKGGNVSLTKQVANLRAVSVGLGWAARQTSGPEFDLDASALLVNQRGHVLSDEHFVFFNNLLSPDGSVQHTGDELVGGSGGDDETINVDLALVPAECVSITFAVSIYEADSRRQNFGQIRDAYIRVVDQGTGTEIARYDLVEDAATETAMIFGEVYRYDGEWKFRAVGQGYDDGLAGIARNYGVNVA